MNYLPYLIFVVVIVGLLALSARTRRRQALAVAEQADRITVGTDVMTTSGLHGTVVARNPDDTVQLSIAPGVEVRWEMAALRDAASLPAKYRRDGDDIGDEIGGRDGGDEPPSNAPESRIDLQKGDPRSDPS